MTSAPLLTADQAKQQLGTEAFAGGPVKYRSDSEELERIDRDLGERARALTGALDALGRLYGPALVGALEAFVNPVLSEASGAVLFARFLNRHLGYQRDQLARLEERLKEEQRWRFEHQNRASRAEGHLAELYGGMQRLDRRRPPEWVANILDTFA